MKVGSAEKILYFCGALGNALRLEAEEVVRRDGGGTGGRSPIKGKMVKK